MTALAVLRQPLIQAPTGCRTWVDGHDQGGDRRRERSRNSSSHCPRIGEHGRERTSQKARLVMRTRGRPAVCRRLASCCRRARFSSANSARLRRAERNAPRRLIQRPVMARSCLGRRSSLPNRRHRREAGTADEDLANRRCLRASSGEMEKVSSRQP
jgi:hypothetical protein